VITVVLADDHQVLREGLRTLLNRQPDLKVVGEAEDGDSAVDLCQELHPDVVVMDLAMPGLHGFDAIRELRRRKLDLRIVVLSMHSTREFVLQALRAGCDGFVPKASTHTDLVQAIRATYAGERYLHPSAATAVVSELLDEGRQAHLLEELSEREIQVLRLTAMGYTSREIGEHLALSPKTIETYRQRAMTKLKLDSRAELVQFALKAGLLSSRGG
jgi:two-component system response regulator NreC